MLKPTPSWDVMEDNCTLEVVKGMAAVAVVTTEEIEGMTPGAGDSKGGTTKSPDEDTRGVS